jgi:para-nitrobenzyl esterase
MSAFPGKWSGLLVLSCLLAIPAATRAQEAPRGPRNLPPESPAGAQLTRAVRIAGGLIQGTVAPSGVRTFRGIPFAAPPVGERRWKPPQPAAGWKGVRRATRFGPRCMQLPIFSDMVFRSDGMSEDCLYLNVWAPPAASAAGRRLPVLVYFYGGGFVGGDGSELRYDGESLARRGIVVVTVNYRLGVFGFLAHPELTRESPRHASGDYGLLDQAAALGWVWRNVTAFGGDPRRITIGGESAGSISVCALMASPLSRRLVAGAIGESGGMIRPTAAAVPLEEAEKVGVLFADSVGAGSLAALRAVPADSLLKMTGRPGSPWPRATVDGYFLPRSPAEIFAAGEQAHVPLLVGWNSQESGWRGLLGSQEPTPENYAAALRGLFGDQADEALRLFPGGTPDQVVESGTLLAGAHFIAYSTWKWAELQSRTGHGPVYRYLYAHPRPAPKVPGEGPPPPGAVHSAEIEYALGNLATNDVYAWTAADDSLSEVMETYFANFVKQGNPNGAGLPRWPAAYSGDTVRVMVLDVHPHAEPAQHREAFRFLDRFYARSRAP